MTQAEQQRICVKFCFKLDLTATETYQMLVQPFGDEALSKSKTFEWYKRFKKGRQFVEDVERSGRSLYCNIPKKDCQGT
ncbi:Protein GVQW3 [Anthophora plagiata]